ncbi:cell division protein CrgA [Leucobacter sp. wl10]|uniref:cell division protein CrgA n=1 Tax=Leucobacter sp. wl10 TaxID=2304677 RepID=UPI000E5AB5CD|nr:cell division protein CrgA [Leucobacter sp. wl10]RGE18545.1 cell division protein CrgA [Leucobacter sp. wl10]
MAAAGKNVSKRKSGELAQERAEAASARKDAPNPVWFKPVMFGFMLLGLVWIVLYYITSATPLPLPVPALGQANIFVGFGLVLVGFLMTPWWK